MLYTVTVLSLLVAAAARPSASSLDSYTFEKYVQDFNLQYKPAELESRRTLFTTELARVRAHNAKNLSWKEGVNKFTAMTASEKNSYTGRSKGAHAIQSKTLKHAKSLPEDFVTVPVSALPKNHDWRSKGIENKIKFNYPFLIYFSVRRCVCCEGPGPLWIMLVNIINIFMWFIFLTFF